MGNRAVIDCFWTTITHIRCFIESVTLYYGVDSIIDTVCNHKALGPGAIILCHNGAKYTADALDTMLTNLEDQGYTIVPISELIMRKNYHMDATGKQIADERGKTTEQ